MKKLTITLLLSLMIISVSFSQTITGRSATKQVNISTADYSNGIPSLVTTQEFIEPSGNNLLDAEETAKIKITISNKGSNSAFDVGVKASIDNNQNITFAGVDKTFGELEAGKSEVIYINISANAYVSSGSRTVSLKFTEHGGFIPRPVNMQIGTQKMLEPTLTYLETGITEEQGNGNSIIEQGELIVATILVQNRGQGEANNVNYYIEGDQDGIFIITKNFPRNKNIGTLKPNQTAKIQFAFSVTWAYEGSDNLPLKIRLTESKGRFGGTHNLGMKLKEQNLAAVDMEVDGNYQQETKITDASLTADVDKNIPNCGKKHNNRFALIIGNEHYVKNNGLDSDVPFALNDALVFKKYAISTFGIPEDNIKYISNGTATQMKNSIKNFAGLMAINSSEREFYIYYAGHGYHNETKDAYLMPVDVKSTNMDDAIKLSEFYKTIASYPTKSTTVFLDACFSGGGRDGALVTARSGIKLKPNDVALQSNLVVFAASSDKQVSKPYNDKKHGLFTYYLLKQLQESNGNITYGNLATGVINDVKTKSRLLTEEEQTPKVNISPKVKNSWENMKF